MWASPSSKSNRVSPEKHGDVLYGGGERQFNGGPPKSNNGPPLATPTVRQRKNHDHTAGDEDFADFVGKRGETRSYTPYLHIRRRLLQDKLVGIDVTCLELITCCNNTGYFILFLLIASVSISKLYKNVKCNHQSSDETHCWEMLMITTFGCFSIILNLNASLAKKVFRQKCK